MFAYNIVSLHLDALYSIDIERCIGCGVFFFFLLFNFNSIENIESGHQIKNYSAGKHIKTKRLPTNVKKRI